MKINIILNEPITRASGGYKVVYQYANYMSENGHDVCIYYHCRKNVLLSRYNFPFFVKLMIAKMRIRRGVSWFHVNNEIQSFIIKEISNENIRNADAILATAVDTARPVYELDKSKGTKYYFIQGFEDWVFDADKVKETYSYGMKNIVIAQWLKSIVDENAITPSIFIPNGIDSNIFYIKNNIEKRNPASVAILYHPRELKGSKYAIEVVKKLRKVYHELHVEMFGISERPSELPEWISYTYKAKEKDLLEIYNKCSIFLCTSLSEGFGLTGAESMFCGCALVTTDTLGVREYANENNALICRPKDVGGLFRAVSYLIDNNDKRIELARKGHTDVVSLLDFDQACQKFLRVITENCHDNN